MEIGKRPASSSSSGYGLGLGLVLWNLLGFFYTRGSRKRYVRIYGSSGKLPPNIFVEASIDRRNGSLHLHKDRKLPRTTMVASNYFHASISNSTNLRGNFHGSKYSSTGFHGSFHGSRLISTGGPLKLVETSMAVDRTEVGGPLSKSCGSSWKFVILVKVGGSM